MIKATFHKIAGFFKGPWSTKKQILISLLAVGVLILILGAIKGCKIAGAIAAHSSFQPPPEAITSFKVEEISWRKFRSAVGSIAPVQGVTITAELPGTVIKVAVESGVTVEKGALLVELDSSVEQGNLLGAKAKEERQKKAVIRARTLRATNAISADDLDNAEWQYQQAASEVKALEATIAKKKIVAPFTGRAGIRKVNVGEYLKEGSEILPLHSLSPLYVNFALPQQSMRDLAQGNKIEVAVDAYPGVIFEGVLSAINPQVDPISRNVEIQGTLENKDERLKPGMFGQVTVVLPEEEKVLAIPSTAVNFAPFSDTVYVIDEKKNEQGVSHLEVRQQVVHLGEKRGELIAVLSGLKAGDRIASSGIFKLRAGASVIVNDQFAPGAQEFPTPPNT